MMRHLFAAMLVGLLLTPDFALASDEGGAPMGARIQCSIGFTLINEICFPTAEPTAGSDEQQGETMQEDTQPRVAYADPRGIRMDTASSSGGIIVPLLVLAIIVAAAAN